MKKTILFCFGLLFLLSSCKKEGLYTEPILEVGNSQNAVLLKKGTFVATSGIAVRGSLEIRKQPLGSYVSLMNFSVSSGPDLKVYLSKNDYPAEFVNLGALELGKTDYKIPEGVSIENYTHVLIHCQQYNHLFAIAKLD